MPMTAFSQSNINLEFRNKNQPTKTLTLIDLGIIAAPVLVKIFEAHENRNRVYKAYSAQVLFDEVFGKAWREAGEILFMCTDGYQPSIPVAKFLTHNAYFAFAQEDDSPFIVINALQNNEIVQLGPLYLVWDNINSKELLDDGASYMPYQIREIELTVFASRFPNLAPPKKASLEARRGFLHFRKHCMACHTINDEGGGKATELNYPISVVERMPFKHLIRWIGNPSSMRYNTVMPGLAKETPNRQKVISEIISYLRAMSKVKYVPNKGL